MCRDLSREQKRSWDNRNRKNKIPTTGRIGRSSFALVILENNVLLHSSTPQDGNDEPETHEARYDVSGEADEGDIVPFGGNPGVNDER